MILSRPSTIEPVSVLGVGKIKGPCTVEGVFVLGVGKIKGPCTVEGVFVLGVGKIKGPCTIEPVSVLGLAKNGPFFVTNAISTIYKKSSGRFDPEDFLYLANSEAVKKNSALRMRGERRRWGDGFWTKGPCRH